MKPYRVQMHDESHRVQVNREPLSFLIAILRFVRGILARTTKKRFEDKKSIRIKR